MQCSCWVSSKDQTSRTGPNAGPIGWFGSSQQEGQLRTSIIGQKSLEASRSCFKIPEPGKGLKINSNTSHLFQMMWTPSSPNLNHWQPKQCTILMHSQCCHSMRPNFHSRWWTTSTRDWWTSKDGRRLPANTIRTTQWSRISGVYSKKHQRRPLQEEQGQRCRPNYWLESWESRCQLQTLMPWTRVLIGPNPIIIGKREPEAAQPTPKMKQRIGTRPCNTLVETNTVISKRNAPTRTKKERNQ